MVGHPDWQHQPARDGAPLVEEVGRALNAGLGTSLLNDERVSYDNLLVHLNADTNSVALVIGQGVPSDVLGFGDLSIEAYVNTVAPLYWVVPVLTGFVGSIGVTCAAAGACTFDLCVVPTNRPPQALYDRFNAALAFETNNAIAAATTERTDMRPYTGWAVVQFEALTSAMYVTILARDHNLVSICRPIRELVAAGTTITRTVWIPPHNCEWVVENPGAAGNYHLSITPAWGGAG